jgi:hypothetical protein
LEDFMKRSTFSLFLLGLFLALFVSCVSITDRQIPKVENDKLDIIGEVQTTFTSWQPLYIIMGENIKAKAYSQLLERAKMEYGGNVDVKNIKIIGSFSPHTLWAILVGGLGMNIGTLMERYELNAVFGTPLVLAFGDFQKITATGDVVVPAGSTNFIPRQSGNQGQSSIEGALTRAAKEVSENFTARSRLAIVYITAENKSQTDFISGELEHILRRQGFVIIDRSELDRIRAEQRFGTSGEVDDSTAARIGNIAGASVVITGRVDGEGNLRRLRLRALDTSSGQVIGTASERL